MSTYTPEYAVEIAITTVMYYISVSLKYSRIGSQKTTYFRRNMYQ